MGGIFSLFPSECQNKKRNFQLLRKLTPRVPRRNGESGGEDDRRLLELNPGFRYGQDMRFRSLILSLFLGSLASCGGERPGSQSAFLALRAAGGEVAAALETYHEQKQRWPEKLQELSEAGTLRDSKALKYPKVEELGTQQDYLKAEAKVEWEDWRYYAPPKDSPDTPLLVAPHAYTHRDGRKLEKPQRLVIKVGTPAQSVNDEDVPTLVEMMAPK
jgi:hypothetical protein